MTDHSPPSAPTLRRVAAAWGERVADARRARRLSQADLAERAGVSQQTISKLERGRLCPHDRLKLRLAQALGIAPHELWAWLPAEPRADSGGSTSRLVEDHPAEATQGV
ncbi:MAG: helix-turn-helix transcriptional regulator [Actinobacteria bacterium]|nr:helix-turn-helix transcriptional regulator [Actinomycetota bacterium]